MLPYILGILIGGLVSNNMFSFIINIQLEMSLIMKLLNVSSLANVKGRFSIVPFLSILQHNGNLKDELLL